MKRTSRLVPVLLSLGPLILFLPGLLQGGSLYWGTPMLQFVPWRELAFDILRGGHIPFWNPYSGMGAPLLANYQTAVFYPPNWLFIFLPIAWGQGLLVAGHLIFTAFGMGKLVNSLGGSQLAQIISALAFSLSGYLIARAGFLSITAAAAWLPWIMYAAERLIAAWGWREGNRRTTMLLLGWMLGMQWLAGHAQTAWYTLLFLGVWVSWRGGAFNSWSRFKAAAAGLALAGLTGFALSAIQIFPTLQYLHNSSRSASLSEVFALTYSFWPWRLTGLLLPDLFGNPARNGYWGYANYYEDALYIGILPFLLALHAVRRGWTRTGEHRSLVRFLVAVIAAAFLLALGGNTPVFLFLFRHVPTFNLFQAPARWNLLLVFSLSLLAGIGVDLWVPPEGRSLYWTRLGTAGAGIIGGAAFLGGAFLGDVDQSFITAFALMGLWMLASGILSLLKRKAPVNAWTVAAGFVVLVDLVYAGSGLNPVIPSGVYHGRTQLSWEVSNGHRLYMDAALEYRLKYEILFRFDTFDSDFPAQQFRETGLPNMNVLDRIPSVNNFDPLQPDRYETWMAVLAAQTGAVESHLLGLMDAGWRAVADGSSSGVRYLPLEDAARLRVVPAAVAVDSGDEALVMLQDEGFDPNAVVYVENHAGGALPAGSGGSAVPSTQTNPNQVRINVETDEGGWLVLSDTFYPGWQAYMDDEPVEMYPADYLFRAVWVPEGQHQVEFRYESDLFWAGCGLSLLAAAAVGVGFAWRRD
ncbi:MAG: YfhO family protein [Anaerolineales bacterium]|nr:YfhO family protein [Anaerolineales bacterium]